MSLLLFRCSVVSDSVIHGLHGNPASTPGFPVLHYLPEFAQTHVHWVSDAIQPSHSLSPLSPPALLPSIRVNWSLLNFGSFPHGSVGKESVCNVEDTGDDGSIPGLGRSPEEGNGNPNILTWKIPWTEERVKLVERVGKSQTWRSD